ncbi:hypothetical protein [Actinacidiphila yeochonensis]|uniref:hypothetical protein n=1 Tax=Actinacidiphila yeochonensis TaxID=89050 RepID=UPI0012FEDC80|nr:hypothetical protein [Actinacidiphila yeochonensis]
MRLGPRALLVDSLVPFVEQPGHLQVDHLHRKAQPLAGRGEQGLPQPLGGGRQRLGRRGLERRRDPQRPVRQRAQRRRVQPRPTAVRVAAVRGAAVRAAVLGAAVRAAVERVAVVRATIVRVTVLEQYRDGAQPRPGERRAAAAQREHRRPFGDPHGIVPVAQRQQAAERDLFPHGSGQSVPAHPSSLPSAGHSIGGSALLARRIPHALQGMRI